MNKGKIGVQMSTIKGKLQELGTYGTMKGLADLGYHCVEVSQLPTTPENIDALKRACQDFDMKVAAMSAALDSNPGRPMESLSTDFDKIVADCRALDCNFLRIGMLPFPCMASKDKALDFARRADEMALRLKDQGIELYYHNHHVEFQKFDGEYLLDLIKDNAPHMGFELDIHWIHRGGEDPVKIINQYAGRIRLLHLKDYRIGHMGPEAMEALQAGDIKKFMGFFQNIVEFAEVGEGSLDVPAAIAAGFNGGAEYFLIEQDTTYGRDEFESLKISRDNLQKMGYADWF